MDNLWLLTLYGIGRGKILGLRICVTVVRGWMNLYLKSWKFKGNFLCLSFPVQNKQNVYLCLFILKDLKVWSKTVLKRYFPDFRKKKRKKSTKPTKPNTHSTILIFGFWYTKRWDLKAIQEEEVFSEDVRANSSSNVQRPGDLQGCQGWDRNLQGFRHFINVKFVSAFK